MALSSGLARAAACLLWLACVVRGEKVWTICLGEQPMPPTPAERILGVNEAMRVACTKEYTFQELCQVDFNVVTYPEVGTLALNAFQRKPGDDAGFINHGIKPGHTGFLVCFGEPVMEVWEEANAPPKVTTVQFLEQLRSSADVSRKNRPAVLPAHCWGEFFAMEDIVGGIVFEVRKTILREAGCGDGPFVCPCGCRSGGGFGCSMGRYKLLETGKGGDRSDEKVCDTDLAAFSRLSAEEIAERYPIFSVSNATVPAPPPTLLRSQGKHGCWAGDARSRAKGPAFYEKMTTRYVARDDEGRVEIVSHGQGEALHLDAAAGRYAFVRLDGSEVPLDGALCVQNHSRDLLPFEAGAADEESPDAALVQKQLPTAAPVTAAPVTAAPVTAAPVTAAPVATVAPVVTVAPPTPAPPAGAPGMAPVTKPPVTYVTAAPTIKPIWQRPKGVPHSALMTDGTLTMNG